MISIPLPPPGLAALDIDLNTYYARWEDGASYVVKSGKDPRDAAYQVINWLNATPNLGTVLVEVASPLDYTDDKAIAYNKRKWTIANIYVATLLSAHVRPTVLVAPSHVWTKGYPLAARHALCKARDLSKDLRECAAMMWFYRRDPTAWLPLPQYVAELSAQNKVAKKR